MTANERMTALMNGQLKPIDKESYDYIELLQITPTAFKRKMEGTKPWLAEEAVRISFHKSVSLDRLLLLKSDTVPWIAPKDFVVKRKIDSLLYYWLEQLQYALGQKEDPVTKEGMDIFVPSIILNCRDLHFLYFCSSPILGAFYLFNEHFRHWDFYPQDFEEKAFDTYLDDAAFAVMSKVWEFFNQLKRVDYRPSLALDKYHDLIHNYTEKYRTSFPETVEKLSNAWHNLKNEMVLMQQNSTDTQQVSYANHKTWVYDGPTATDQILLQGQHGATLHINQSGSPYLHTRDSVMIEAQKEMLSKLERHIQLISQPKKRGRKKSTDL